MCEQHTDHGHPHPHTHSHTQTRAVVNRLARAIGHLERVKAMVEEGRDCAEVLIQLSAVRSALKEATAIDDISVIVFRSPCVLLERKPAKPFWVNASCTACGSCATLGCPAIARDESGVALIDAGLCIGCGQCVQYCRFNAIVPE